MVPKFHIRTTSDLKMGNQDHVELLQHMRSESLRFLAYNHSADFNLDNFHLGFHTPKATIIKHLHLHILVGDLSTRGNIEFCNLLFDPLDSIL